MADESTVDDHWAPVWLRPVSTRPRLVAGIAVGLAVGLLSEAVLGLRLATAAIVGWDVGVLAFLVLVFWAWNSAEPHHIRKRASLQDEGRNVMLILVLGGVIASVTAIVFELTEAKAHRGVAEIVETALGLGTVALSWVFLQTFLAQHYTHEYYATSRSENGEEHGGLDFPGCNDPDYWDFFHFSITIGATAQTADIQITSKPMRFLVTWHALMSYTFNTVVLALAISELAGLFG
jgi:uncharacterized membrane protein